jgi:hypothetical protein
MLPAAPAKKNSDPEFFHDLSVWTREECGVNRGDDTEKAKTPESGYRIPVVFRRLRDVR